ncbi:DUF4336 domain-containing protein [Martelella lutilitoris]|uniref:DUF4336 domain-containing protein n=1 Tax=Martelella lutilitoris TaxID=2583532 RepID=A0A5C4JQM8_9HYPH|nr:DUF4336 domain-containing protein [Martelella lutilitoris]TNB47502.1 DUF4336 domain-containing protein [Martelella lutilitoris]
MFKEFGPSLWISDGPVVTANMGFRYPTRMAVIRLKDGGLVIWSPVAASPALVGAVTSLGAPRFIVAPNTLHHLFLQEWAESFPAADIFGPRALAQKRSDIAFAGFLEDEAVVAQWSGEIERVVVDGNRIMTEVVFFHPDSGTAIFTDLIQHFERSWFSGWRGAVARLDAMQGAEPAVPRKFRVAFSDRAATREKVGRILQWPTVQVLFAHGAPVRRDGQAFLKRAFAWLY